MQRIPDDPSNFTAEAIAVGLALDFIRTCATNNKSEHKRENRIHNHRRPLLTLLYMGDRLIIKSMFSDSLSVLKAMNRTR